MFDIGWSELVVIAVVALIAIGPKELPGVLRSVGFWMGKVRRMASEFQGQFQEAMREAEMADLKKHADDLNDMAKSVTSSVTSQFDPYDTLSESQAAKSAPPPVTPPAETGDATPAETPPAPDYSQVAAMPDVVPTAVAPVVPETVPVTPAEPPPARRDA